MTDTDNKRKWRTIGNAYEAPLTKGTGGKQIVCVIDKPVSGIGEGFKLKKLYLFPNVDANGESNFVVRIRESDII